MKIVRAAILSAAAVVSATSSQAISTRPKLSGLYMYTETDTCLITNILHQDTGTLRFHSDTKTYDMDTINIESDGRTRPVVNRIIVPGIPFRIKSDTEMKLAGVHAYVTFGPENGRVATSAMITFAKDNCSTQMSLFRKGD